METLQELVQNLASHGRRQCVGLRQDLGLLTWTYLQMDEKSRQAAAILRDAGVAKGDYVLLRAPKSPEWVAFFLGAMLRGATVVPFDHDSPLEFVQRIAGRVKPRLLLNAGDVFRVDNIPSLDLNCLYQEGPAPPLAELLIPVSSTDAAVIFFTSGSTASPRGVILTHNNIVSTIDQFRRWRWLARLLPVRMAVMAPLSHTQGIMLGLAIPLLLGLCVIYTESTHPSHILRMLRDNRIVFLCTVPRLLHVLAERFRQQRYGDGPKTLGQKLERAKAYALRRHYIFTHMRRIIGYRFWIVVVGGAPLPVADERFWRESGCLLFQGYGLTETSAMVSVNTPWSGAFGSVGKPFSNQEVRLAEDGEILVRGPNVTPGYTSDGNDAAFADGFLMTGDIGRMDHRNRLYILGRKKEVIVTGEGFNVHASDIEAALNASPDIQDSVVVGMERQGHMHVHAILLLRQQGDAATVVAQTNRRLLSHQRIQGWTIWPEPDFPRTALLKPRRSLIVERINALQTRQSDVPQETQPLTLEDLKRIEDKRLRLSAIARHVAEAKLERPEEKDVNLVRDLGVSSLDMIELLMLLEQQSGGVMDKLVTAENITLGRLQDAVREAAREPNLRRRDSKDPPRWASWRLLNILRRPMNAAVLLAWTRLCARLSVKGQERLKGMRGPAIYAVAGHEHGFDTLLVYSSLPLSLRRCLAVVISRWLFRAYLRPGSATCRSEYFWAALGFKLLVPLFFPFALTSHFERTRDDLIDACRLLDEGYSLIVFEGRGVALMAKQCGVPVVPVDIIGNSTIGFKPRFRRSPVSVTFGEVLRSDLLKEQELLDRLDLFYASPGQ